VKLPKENLNEFIDCLNLFGEIQLQDLPEIMDLEYESQILSAVEGVKPSVRQKLIL